MKIMLVNMPKELSKYISLVLKVRWPNLSLFHTDEARQAVQLIHSVQPHVAMLHISERSEGSSSEDCFDLITKIRSFYNVPLIVISQNDDVIDKVKALEMGADDCVSPSCIPMEFIAKVNAILRRCSPDNHGVFLFLNGKMAINYATRQVRVLGNTVKLTPIQYNLLCHLTKNQGRVCSSSELLRHVWGPNYSDDRELLKLNIYRLRSKIEEDPSNPEIIFNERGMGYTIRASDSSE